MNKRILSIAAAGLVLLGAAAPSSALASTGTQTLTDVIQGTIGADGPTPTRTVVAAAGVINAVGTDEFQPRQPGDPDNLDRDTFTFPKDTLSVVVTNVAGNQSSPNPRTCVGHFTQSGSWDIIGGTGAYVGARGALTFLLKGTFIAKRLPGGACSDSEATFIIVDKATGSLTVP